MELDEQFVIPTVSRAKISHKLSYPVGARAISAALASVSQLAELRLHFFPGFDIQLRSGHYEFLRVEYLNNARALEEWPIRGFYGHLEQGRWKIVVQPVPGAVRHRVKRYIVDSALMEIAHWLIQRKQLEQRGGEILAFFYDENDEDFVSRHVSRLEPLRVTPQ